MDIPIIIISFNNHRYVKNTINQLESLNPTMMSNIIIMDNTFNKAFSKTKEAFSKNMVLSISGIIIITLIVIYLLLKIVIDPKPA